MTTSSRTEITLSTTARRWGMVPFPVSQPFRHIMETTTTRTRRKASCRRVRLCSASRQNCSQHSILMWGRGLTPAPSFYHPAVLPVALFLPGIAVVMIAALLPETRLVLRAKLNTVAPLRALPKIALRHKHSHRTAMNGLERLALVFVGEEHALVVCDFQRQICAVTIFTVSNDVMRRW